MKKYSKNLLSRVQEHNLKKVMDETNGDLNKIQDHLEEIGLGSFVHRIPKMENN